MLGVLTGRPLWSSGSMGSLSSKAWWVTCSSCRAENTKASASRTLITSSKPVIQLPRLGELGYDESVMRACRQLANSAVAQSAHTDSKRGMPTSQDDLPLSLSRGDGRSKGRVNGWAGKQG